MIELLKTIGHRLLILSAFGAITVSVSEFWFYQVSEDVDHIGILIVYGLLGYLFLNAIEKFHIESSAGFWVAASLLGFLIEGVAVPVVYSSPPFSILWTSLAWHALITVGIGWFLFKRVMTYNNIALAILMNALFGLSLGIWNSYMWNAQEADDNGQITFIWQNPDAFILQFLVGYVMFVLGHVIFERVAKNLPSFTIIEIWILSAACAVFAIMTAIASGLLIFFPVLPLLIVLCLWSLKRSGENMQTDNAHKNFISHLNSKTIPAKRYAISLLIPITAISSYSLMGEYKNELETNAILIAIAGPVSIWLFVRSIYQIIQRKEQTIIAKH